MTFDQWIDAVNAGVRAQLGALVRTEELSWDSGMWVSASNTAVASLDTDETTAAVRFDGGERHSFEFRAPEATPERVSALIAMRLNAPR